MLRLKEVDGSSQKNRTGPLEALDDKAGRAHGETCHSQIWCQLTTVRGCFEGSQEYSLLADPSSCPSSAFSRARTDASNLRLFPC